MIKQRTLCAGLILLLIAGGCSREAPAETPVPSESPASTVSVSAAPTEPAAQAAARPVLTSRTEKKEYTADGGRVILSMEATLPHIENEDASPAYAEINRYYKSEMASQLNGEAALSPNGEGFLTYAREGYAAAQAAEEDFAGYEANESYTKMLQNGRFLSFLRIQSSYTGGAHGNAVAVGDTFSLADGKRLSLADLFTLPEEETSRRVLSAVLDKMKQLSASEGAYYYDNYENIVPTVFDLHNFYLTQDAVVIFFQPYDVAPWAAGIPTVELPLKQFKDVLKA